MANSFVTLAQAITAGAKLATDTITNLFNGAAPASGLEAQYAKMAFGAPGDLQGVDTTNRFPVALDAPAKAALSSIDGIYAEIVDQPNATTTYICQAAIGTASSAASWRCRRIVVSGNTTVITWAGGAAFNQIADNRASLTYA